MNEIHYDMRGYSNLLICLLLFVASAEGREFHCRSERSGEVETLFVWGDLMLQQTYVNKACNLRIVHTRAS